MQEGILETLLPRSLDREGGRGCFAVTAIQQKSHLKTTLNRYPARQDLNLSTMTFSHNLVEGAQ